MPAQAFKTINVEDLKFDVLNPRYEGITSQRDAILKIVEQQKLKIVKIARDIAENGMNPLKRVMVEPAKGGGYTALEGNRRLAALKLLRQPDLLDTLGLPANIVKPIKKIVAEAAGDIPESLSCVVTTRDAGEHWILLEHTGQNEGVGTVPWDGGQTGRFKGGSPALQAIEFMRPHMDEESIEDLMAEGTTTLQRLLGTPQVREQLGVQLQGKTLSLNPKDDLALARLVAVAHDIVTGDITSRKLNLFPQRVAYATEVAKRRLTPIGTTGAGGGKGSPSGGGKPVRRQSLQRGRLIPGRCKISIPRPRINRIYDELRRLKLEKFVNSGAVLLRVFVELSVDEYGDKNNISFKVPSKSGPVPAGKQVPLREKILLVAQHLEDNKRCTRTQLKGIRTLVSAKSDDPLAIDSWHAYIHNQYYTPSVSQLTRTWDNIEAFMLGLWQK